MVPMKLRLTWARSLNISGRDRGDEFILILKGELELTIDEENYILREGDSMYLDSIAPATWRNVGEMQVQAIWALSPPSV